MLNIKPKIQGVEKGVSLYIAILIMSLLLAMGLGLSNILLNQIKIIKGMGSSVVAFYAADTGIERVLMNKYNAISSNGVSENLDNGAGYLISVLLPGAGCDALNFCIKSVGTYKGTKRAIEATY